MCAKITLCSRNDYPGQVCSIAKALEVVGERWSLLIVRDVMNGKAPLRRAAEGPRRSPATCSPPACSGSSRRTSSSAAPTRRSPERYEYFLTEKGLDLWPALIALLGWGDRHSPDPDGPADADRPQGVRRRGQRPRHLRELRRGPGRPRRPRPPRSRPGAAADRRARSRRALSRTSVGHAAASADDQGGDEMATAAEVQVRDKIFIGGEWVEPTRLRDDRGDQLDHRGDDGDDSGLHRRGRRPRRARRPRRLRLLVADLARGARRLPERDLRRPRRAQRRDRRDDLPGAGHAADAEQDHPGRPADRPVRARCRR